MPESVRVEMNTRGAIALLQSEEVMADLLARGHAVQAAAGKGHEVTSWTGRTRARVSVMATSYGARKAEAIDRNLTRALDAARG